MLKRECFCFTCSSLFCLWWFHMCFQTKGSNSYFVKDKKEFKMPPTEVLMNSLHHNIPHVIYSHVSGTFYSLVDTWEGKWISDIKHDKNACDQPIVYSHDTIALTLLLMYAKLRMINILMLTMHVGLQQLHWTEKF